MNKPIIFICEVPSEEAYLKELDKILREEEIPLVLVPKNASGGQRKFVFCNFSKLSKKYFAGI